MRRLTILLAATAALMLVSVAPALAVEVGPVKVNVVGAGGGEVTSEPEKNAGVYPSGSPPIQCPGVCENESDLAFEGLYAYPAAGSEFVSWTFIKGEDYYGVEAGEFCNDPAYIAEGESEFGGPYCVVRNKANTPEGVEITVCFANEGEGEAGCSEETPNIKLTVEEGEGTVVSNPAGLVCTQAAPGSCEKELGAGTVVLTASPAPGYAFKGWKGCNVGGAVGRQCTVTLTTESLRSVGVKFNKVWRLTAKKSNPNGIFGTTPGGVNCGYGCLSSAADYKEGSLTLKAKPAKNFHFVEFKGGTNAATSCNGVTTETCTITTFNADSAIEEVYAENAKNALTLTKTGGGQGFIKTKPTNINCGYTCTSAKAEFFSSENVPVTVTFNKGTTSVTWTTSAGTCTGKATTCEVPMSAAHTLVAEFN